MSLPEGQPRVRRSIVALALVCAACGPATVTPPSAPVARPVPTASPAIPAQVSFPFQPFRALRTLPVGDGELQVGPLGRRALVKGGTVTEGTPLPESIVGVLRLGPSRLGFVGASAATYVTEGPLSAPVEHRAGPSIEVRRVAVGGHAIVAASANEIHRSVDGGHTWGRLEIKGLRGVVGGVALSAKGEGLLYAIPQRVFGTTDDGATWSVLDSLGLGAEGVDRDGPTEAAGVRLSGLSERAVFQGGKLVVTPDAPAAWAGGPWYETRLGGPWLLIVKHDEGIFTTLLGRLGEPLAPTTLPPGCSSPNTLGDETGLWVSCPGDGKLLRWTKAAGWKTVRTFAGTIDRDEVDLAGDGPIVFQGKACESGACTAPRISFDSGATFVDVKLSAKGTVHAVAFDPRSHQGYLVAEDEGRLAIHVAAPGSPAFARTAWLDLDAKAFGGARATVDDEGVLRVGICRADGSACRLQAVRAGASGPLRWLGPSHDLALVGRRGIWVDDKGVAFETADGGATWARVALPADRDELTCTAFGCVRHGTVRTGWDLPALPLPTIAASLVEPPTPTPPKKAPRQLTCASSGPTVPAAVPPDLLERHDGFSFVEGKGGELVAKTVRAKITATTLLPPEKKGTSVDRIVDGVAVRVTSTTTTLFAPRVDVAWVPLGADQPVHATIPKLPRPQPQLGVVAGSRVLGGVVVRLDDQVLFVDEKGKVKPIDVAPLDSFARTPNGFVSARTVAATLSLAWSGAAPSRAHYRLQPYAFQPSFGRLFSAAEGVFAGGLVDDHPFLIAVPAVRLGDPTEVRTLDPSLDVAQSPCTEPFAGPTVPSADPREPNGWEVVVDGTPLPALLTLRPEKGRVCAVAIVADAGGQRIRVPLADKQHAWSIGKDGLRPLHCK